MAAIRHDVFIAPVVRETILELMLRGRALENPVARIQPSHIICVISGAAYNSYN